MIRGSILALVVGLVLLVAAPAQAAAPDYILVTGPTLARPILLPEWSENHELLISLVDVPKAKTSIIRGLRTRPRLDLALFWRWRWLGNPPPNRPSQTKYHGSFYPSFRGRPAVIVLMVDGLGFPRVAPPRALRILAGRGVPTRLTPGR